MNYYQANTMVTFGEHKVVRGFGFFMILINIMSLRDKEDNSLILC